MKKSKSMKHYLKDPCWGRRMYFAFAFFFLFILTQGKAQTIQRQNIGVCGSNMVAGGALVKQTVGQPYSASTYYENGIGYRPGFQQPSGAHAKTSFIAKTLHSPTLTLSIFPNPAIYSVQIESSEVVSNALLKVMDSSGRLVLRERFSELKSHSIACENWPVGLYLISISDEQNTSYSSKLIITK